MVNLPNWCRAHGEPLFVASLRRSPEDFQVVEELGWEPNEDGEHDFVLIEKIGANTEWVARQLALFAQVPAKDVGYSGLKDRHAVTRQWFSVPRWHSPDWPSLDVEGVTVVEVHRHLRKLRRGAHKSNHFRIVLREPDAVDAGAIESRLAQIARLGVPNYYGEQRFGRNAGNLKLAEDWAGGRRLPRDKRSIAISTIRSYVYNEALSARVGAGTWCQLVVGDKANLDGSGSVFDVNEIDDDLRRRCAEMDIHPSITLAGDGGNIQPEHWQAALNKSRVEPGDRSLRLRVQDLAYELAEGCIVVSFTLGRGAFATSVLRELCDW